MESRTDILKFKLYCNTTTNSNTKHIRFRDKLTLPVVSILVSKIRVSFEILGSEGLRGSIGDLLKLIITNFGNKIVHRETTPGNSI